MEKREPIKVPALCRTAPAALLLYGAFQAVSALLVHREWMGQGSARTLLCLTAALAVFLSVVILGRAPGSDPMVTGLLTGGCFAAVLVLGGMCSLTLEELPAFLPFAAASALLGGFLGGRLCRSRKKKRRKTVKWK